jgi:serine/threonine protein kinase
MQPPDSATPADCAVPVYIQRTAQDGTTRTYTFLEKAGSGGFATVYSAIETPGDIPLAIKCTSKSRFTNPKVKQKLINEIEVHRGLRHPHIVEFRHVCQDENYVYLLLEYCAGGTLFEFLRGSGNFDECLTARFTRQILEALVYLHQRGIVHRDLKLQNLLLTEDNVVKLGDFGLSLNLNADGGSLSPCGTPAYLSPEVVSGVESHTPAIDIWALGVCVFAMLTGQQPFKSNKRDETYNNIKMVQYRWPEMPLLSESAKSFVNSVLRRNPGERPSARALLEHPFILQLHPNPLEHAVPFPRSASMALPGALHESRSVSLPGFAVRISWDYSSRYGLAYLLMNGVTGVCFNDSSRMVITADGAMAHYWESPAETEMQTVPAEEWDASPLSKKLTLMQYFRRELIARAGGESEFEESEDGNEDGIRNVKYWSRTEHGLLFRMANRDVQANFKDKVKMVVDRGTQRIFYASNGVVQVIRIKALHRSGIQEEIRARLLTIKEMSKHLT